MFRFVMIGLMFVLLLVVIALLSGGYAVLRPLMAGLFDISYTTDTALVRVPMRRLESEQPVAVVMIPAAYVPSATNREGKQAVMMLPLEMSFPDLGPATVAAADNPQQVELKSPHISPFLTTAGCDPAMFVLKGGIPAGATQRGSYFQIDPTLLGNKNRNVQAYMYFDRQPQNSIISICEKNRCTATMYLGANICAAVAAPTDQFDNVLRVDFLFALREKLRGYIVVRRTAPAH
jgi:hypothetical protein